MGAIKKLRLKDIPDMVDIAMNAYPGFKYPEKEKFVKRIQQVFRKNSFITYSGYYREDKLLGIQRIHDFKMNFRGKMIPVLGVGGVGVDLLHKKEKICRDLIGYFIDRTVKKGASLAILYPFRPDFYKDMGFGYGAPLYQYKLLPSSFPKGKTKKLLKFLGPDDVDKVVDFYNSQAEKQHGLCLKNISDFQGFLRNPENKVIGYIENKQLKGYLVAKFVKAHDSNFVINNLEILEFLYSDTKVFSEFSTFLNSQADQVKRIIYNTFDPQFYLLIKNISNGSDNLFPSVFHESFSSGIGIMYKIVNVKKFFQQAGNFNNVNITIKFVITDSFADRKIEQIVKFNRCNSSIPKTKEFDVELHMNIAEFSSLVMGVLSFRQAYDHGLVNISDRRFSGKIHKLFYTEQKPQSLNWF